MSRRFPRLALLLPLTLALLAFGTTPVLGAETILIAELTGAEEVPGPGDPDGEGFAEITIDPEAGTVCWHLWADPATVTLPTAAHIHAGAAGVAGDIVVTLSPPDASGEAEGCTDADAALLQAIVDDPGAYYVNVHNADFPAGAIRGQLEIPLPVLFAGLDGEHEVPGPGDPDGSGLAVLFDIDVAAGSFCYDITVEGIDPATAAHVHVGVPGAAGPPVIPMTPPDANGVVQECGTADPTLLQQILDVPASYYVNVHTAAFPDGAVRGQLSTEPPPTEDCVPPEICNFGIMPPGTYTYGGFPASVSFTTTEPWTGRVFPDGFGLEAVDQPAAIYVIEFTGNVFEPPCSDVPAATGTSVQAFVDWIAAHPSLDAGMATATSVGGAAGFSIDVTGALPDGCDAVPVFGPADDPFFMIDGERVRFVAVNVLGTTVVFIIDVFEPTDDFDAFLARAQGVLNTMVFALPPAPTPTPSASAPAVSARPAASATPAASGLPNTAGVAPAAGLEAPMLVIPAVLLIASGGILVARRRTR